MRGKREGQGYFWSIKFEKHAEGYVMAYFVEF